MSVHFFSLEPNQTVSTCFSKNTSAFHNSLNYFFRIYNLLPLQHHQHLQHILKNNLKNNFFSQEEDLKLLTTTTTTKKWIQRSPKTQKTVNEFEWNSRKKVLPRSSWTKARWFFFDREHPLVNFESRVLAGQESRWTTPSRTSRRTSRWRASGRWSPSRRPSTWTPGPWRMRPRLTSGFQSPPETCRENACPSERGKRTNSCCSYIAQSWSKPLCDFGS